MGTRNENIQLFILEEMRVRNRTEQEMSNVFKKQADHPANILQEPQIQGMISFVETLSQPEDTLLSEKKEQTESEQILQTHREMMAAIERLNQEKTLLTEKKNLLETRQMLQTKIAQEIENRKSRIEQFKIEITDLKRRCKTLQTALEPPIKHN